MADDDIPLIPAVPAALREAAQLGSLVPFVGAGASCLAGCPNWSEFADKTLRFFVDLGKLTHAQLSQLSDLTPLVKLSLARSLEVELGVVIDFKSLLHPTPRHAHPDGHRLYSTLSRIAKTFVTTNYDEWLDDIPEPFSSISGDVQSKQDALPRQRTVYYKRSDLTARNLNMPGAVLHLHGSLKDPQGMIVTTRDYVNHYANDRWDGANREENPVLTFLENLFKQKTVLFIGYGLKELAMLEYVILKTRASQIKGLDPSHFILQGFFSHEVELMKAMRRYYLDCGIALLPFLRDYKDHRQLLGVLDEFAKKLPASDLAVLLELKQMGDLLND